MFCSVSYIYKIRFQHVGIDIFKRNVSVRLIAFLHMCYLISISIYPSRHQGWSSDSEGCVKINKKMCSTNA